MDCINGLTTFYLLFACTVPCDFGVPLIKVECVSPLHVTCFWPKHKQKWWYDNSGPSPQEALHAAVGTLSLLPPSKGCTWASPREEERYVDSAQSPPWTLVPKNKRRNRHFVTLSQNLKECRDIHKEILQ